MTFDNAYADLLSTAKKINRADDFAPYCDFTWEQAAEFVAEHATQLAAARQALTRPCHVEVRTEKSFYQEHLSEIEPLRRLIHLFACEARLAGQQKNSAQLLRSGLDLIELGISMRRGGLIFDMLFAFLPAGMGIDVLRKHRTMLGDDQRNSLISALLRIEADSEPIEVIIARDREWEIATDYSEDEALEFKPLDPEESGVPLEFQRAMHEMVKANIERERKLPEGQKKEQERGIELFHQAMLRLLITDLALRRFQEKQRAFPNRLHLLTPSFVPAVPLDPFTKAPFSYRRHGDGFELYSTGPKAVDAGGSFGSRSMVSMHRADLCLDVSDIADPENVCEIAQEIMRGG